jgi:hypothetical protein
MLYQDSEAGSSVLGIVQAYLLFFVIAKIARSVRLTPKAPYLYVRYSSQVARPEAVAGT